MFTRGWVGLLMLTAAVLMPLEVAPMAQARSAPSPFNCAALVLHLAPGLNPPPAGSGPRPGADAPRTPFAVSVPLYPGLTPLPHFIGSPFFSYPTSAYLESASAEYHTAMSIDMMQSWYQKAMPACGWQPNGSWDGNAGAFPTGISFARPNNRDTTADIGFNVTADGSTDVAIAVEAIRYPVPPPRARLHGPFMELRVVIRVHGNPNTGTSDTLRLDITDHQSIRRLVGAIDGIRRAFTVPGLCLGGFNPNGPAWLTFVRPNGSQVHAFEEGPGECGGLAVNHFRWLLDPGKVWNLILRLAKVKA